MHGFTVPLMCWHFGAQGSLPIHLAVADGRTDIIELLVSADDSGEHVAFRFNGECKTPLEEACTRGDQRVSIAMQFLGRIHRGGASCSFTPCRQAMIPISATVVAHIPPREPPPRLLQVAG